MHQNRHSHAARRAGAYGDQLLDWLQNYVFPDEAQYGDASHAEKVCM
jgi:guanine deaminase